MLRCESREKSLKATRHSNKANVHCNCHVTNDFESFLQNTFMNRLCEIARQQNDYIKYISFISFKIHQSHTTTWYGNQTLFKLCRKTRGGE